MNEPRNKAQSVAALVGRHTPTDNKNQFSGDNLALAGVLDRHPSLVTRMVKAGAIPVRYNSVLLEWARERGLADEMVGYLGRVCPCCGGALPLD